MSLLSKHIISAYHGFMQANLMTSERNLIREMISCTPPSVISGAVHYHQLRSRGDNMFGSVRPSVCLRALSCLNRLTLMGPGVKGQVLSTSCPDLSGSSQYNYRQIWWKFQTKPRINWDQQPGFSPKNAHWAAGYIVFLLIHQ